jgi:hypothetical protein
MRKSTTFFASRACPSNGPRTLGTLGTLSALRSLRQFPPTGFAIPFLERLGRDLSLHEKFGEFPSLRLALEWHEPPYFHNKLNTAIPARSPDRAASFPP